MTLQLQLASSTVFKLASASGSAGCIIPFSGDGGLHVTNARREGSGKDPCPVNAILVKLGLHEENDRLCYAMFWRCRRGPIIPWGLLLAETDWT